MGGDDAIRIPLGQWVSDLIDWVIDTFGGFFDVIATIFGGLYTGVAWLFLTPPFWVIIIAITAIAWLAKGYKLAIGTVIGLLLIGAVGQWTHAMQTIALTLVAVVIAVVVAIPVGIWAARSQTVSAIVRPILDFLQTMPAFVYLIPAIFLFGVGVVPGIVATILFAIAPGVRLTELGIRGVDKEVVEAGNAFGATPGRILRQIQLPLARPSIMAGVNQVIMLSLSMAVIASMVGAPGLGRDIIPALSRVDIALGFEAGLAVVIIAMILDRITGAFAATGPARRPRRRAVTGESPATAEKEPAGA